MQKQPQQHGVESVVSLQVMGSWCPGRGMRTLGEEAGIDYSQCGHLQFGSLCMPQLAQSLLFLLLLELVAFFARGLAN